jgi:hypothetical protein
MLAGVRRVPPWFVLGAVARPRSAHDTLHIVRRLGSR